MRLKKLIIILPLLWWAFDVRAQVPQELSSMPEQWQLTLDVIKAKAQTLMIQNNGLQVEYRQLIGQVQKLRQSISDLQYKNEATNRFLKQRHNCTDQQMRIEELTQGIKTKKQQARIFDQQSENLTRKQGELGRKIQQLKRTVSNIGFQEASEKQKMVISQNSAQFQADDQLIQLRKQLENENKQEVLLENELGALKSSDKRQNLNGDALKEENKQLEARLDVLRLQKLQHERKSSDAQLAQANGRTYDQLRRRKDQLEVSISTYEARMDQLRESSMIGLSWPLQKKNLIHNMVQVDAHNNQMREQNKVLREDIDILKDQVAKLERRVDFVQGKDTK